MVLVPVLFQDKERQLDALREFLRGARGGDVVDGLDRLARRKHVDLIAVLHRNIGLLAGMFHPSTAQELAQRIELPLLVLEQNRN